jgi:SprT-like protein
MTDKDLQQLVEQVSLQWFNKPFAHKAVFNQRLKTTAGRYIHRGHTIELNPHYYRIQGYEELISTIKHELCHYHLALARRPFDHRSTEFRTLLQQVGGGRYAKPCPELRNKSTALHVYCCSQCGQQYRRRRKIDTRRFVCGKCKGKLNKISQ